MKKQMIIKKIGTTITQAASTFFNRNRTLKAFSLLSVSAFLALSGNAQAENGHAYNGSYCSNYYGNQATSFNTQHNGIRNNTSSYKYVSCPVVVDEIAKTSGTTRIWVHYTGTGTVSCSLFSKNGNGSTRQSRSGSRANTGWLSIDNLTSDDFWGSYSMFCGVPANGTLNTIWVGEQS